MLYTLEINTHGKLYFDIAGVLVSRLKIQREVEAHANIKVDVADALKNVVLSKSGTDGAEPTRIGIMDCSQGIGASIVAASILVTERGGNANIALTGTGTDFTILIESPNKQTILATQLAGQIMKEINLNRKGSFGNG